ncbi:MAG: Reverse gyrase 1 [Candidatus Woesearchaeota archaeon]|nr:Reverse gyrase 1 [Candidatus Woesearchaeota archaeon]
MSYELVITEKPKAANKIATALADGKAIRKSYRRVPYYEVTHGDKDLVVACAVGHLYQVAEKKKQKFNYPVFNIDWKASYLVSKSSKFTKKYLDAIKKLKKDADSYTVATDYDVEGEVIGYNVITQICKQKDAARMKFSTLTKNELRKAYENKSKSINWGLANAGIARHFLDWMYGINLSRALTTSLKKAGLFKILSSGRVQGPALKIIVEKEKEIKKFVPKPYWEIELKGNAHNGPINAWHEKDKFWKEKDVKIILQKTKGKKAVIKKISKRKFKQNPPTPFDLTTLQTEAYRQFGISPKQLLSLAQNLYVSGYISYPRTSSQKLPKSIGYKKILKNLSKQKSYKKLCDDLLKKKLIPNEGKKKDPAHPAIYPTGDIPKSLKKRERKVYDLIVKRFMAVFGNPAQRQSMKIYIDVSQEIFIAKGKITLEPGWHVYYQPYVRLKEKELPKVEKGEEVIVKKIISHEKETKPPRRYTPASIIKALAKKGLGTKSTRANVVETLYNRDYITGKSIEATKLGIIIIDTLEKYSPLIIDTELTRKFEKEMQEVKENKKSKDEIISEAEKILTKILKEFKENEDKIGKELAHAKMAHDKKMSTIGNCTKCDSELVIKKGKYGKFIACKNYPECKETFSLPNNALVKPSDKVCEHCKNPMVKLIRKRKRPQEICINKDCKSKETGAKKTDKKCPKCGSDLLLRKSVYGSFYGCKKYPKCKYTEDANGSKQKKKD